MQLLLCEMPLNQLTATMLGFTEQNLKGAGRKVVPLLEKRAAQHMQPSTAGLRLIDERGREVEREKERKN